jgi:hypothetical protein
MAAADLRLDSAIKPGADERKLTPNEVKTILGQLIRDDPTAQYPYKHGIVPSDTSWALIHSIAMALPDEFYYESVLRRIDRRQIYAQVMAVDAPGSTTWGGMEFTPKLRAKAAEWWQQNTDDIRATATAIATQKGITDPAALEREVAKLSAMPRGGSIVESPQSRLAQMVAETAGATVEGGGAPGSAADFVTQYRNTQAGSFGQNLQSTDWNTLMTPADLQSLFRMASPDQAIATAIDQDAYLRQDAMGGRFRDVDRSAPWAGDGARIPGAQRRPDDLRVVYDDDVPMDRTMPRPRPTSHQTEWQEIEYERRLENQAAAARGERSYSVNEVTNLLYTMKPDELRRTQNMLRRAGYYDNEDGATFQGDPTDNATQIAWRRLISDSVKTGTPMVDLMKRRAVTFAEAQRRREEEEAKANMRDIQLTDSAAIRVRADELGQGILGRKMRPEEQSSLVEFIHGMQRKQGEAMAGQPNGRIIEDIDVNARIEEYLTAQNPVEAGGKDAADAYELFTRLLAGPGRPQ